jgi:hypothetical protein
MELQDLVGEHTLDAVDFETEKISTWGEHFEDANVIRFRLDGVVYVAVEDPEDGYRSCLGELKLADTSSMTSVFPPIKVIGEYSDYGEESDETVLRLKDVITKETVVEVGTDYSADYYPSFVSYFNPGAMITNKGVK